MASPNFNSSSFSGNYRTQVCLQENEKQGIPAMAAMDRCVDAVNAMKLFGDMSGCKKWRMHPGPSGYVKNVASNWIGILEKITTDKDGDADFTIKLSDQIEIVTKESIKSDSSMYESLGDLEEGSKVIFNGVFATHDEALTTGWFLDTTNLVERTAMTNPVFQFKFTSIKPRN